MNYSIKNYLLLFYLLSVFSFVFFYNPALVYAQSRLNNKFGIHLAQPYPDDLVKAKELVNANGGDWGYVTLVMQENDRSKSKWQDIFNKMRELHLIPIVRLATQPQGAQWRRPSVGEAKDWSDFLDSLNWVVKDRYIILFNEPNHGQEWGGSVDVKNYAEVELALAKELKAKNKDFFVMMAGLDASAPHGLPYNEDEADFLKTFFNYITIDQFNDLFSGLASHSYPNPAFAGSPDGLGRGTVRSYLWELQLLEDLGVKKNLPVFITETGWDHAQVGLDNAANNFIRSFQDIWLADDRVKAVTPFVLDYQGDPFLNFSWKLPTSEVAGSQPFYPQYYAVQSLQKVKGEPEQIEKGTIDFDSPKELVGHSSFHFIVHLKNQGQAVWDKDFGYSLSLQSVDGNPFEYFFSDLREVGPFEEADVDLYVKTNGTLGKRLVDIVLQKNNKPLLDKKEWHFEIFPLPSVSFQVSLFPHLHANASDFEIQIFNDKQELVFKKKNIKVTDGDGFIPEVQNIALLQKYRIVVLKKGYLPRQTFITFKKGNNAVGFKLMLPLDFNGDGKLDVSDFFPFLKSSSK